jgi:hypothetical protein
MGCAARSRDRFDQALALSRELGDTGRERAALCGIARTAAEAGEADARERMRVAVRACLSAGDMENMVDAIMAAASLAAHASQPEVAAQLIGAASRLREQSPEPLHPDERLALDRLAQPLIELLGSNAYSAAHSLGRTMDAEAATAFALGSI